MTVRPDLHADDAGLQGESIGALFSRLFDSARDFARAEIAVVKQTVALKLGQAKASVILGITAVMIVQASLTVLLAALGLGLARWLGPAGGIAIAGVIGLAAAGLCVYLAITRLTAAPAAAAETTS